VRPLLVVGGLLLALTAHAADVEWYLDAATGWNYPKSIALDSSDARIEFDRGVFNLSSAVGVRLPSVLPQWRAELGYGRFENSPEILFGAGAGLELDSDRLDRLRSETFSLNLLRDFRVGDSFRPYVGAGIGYSKVDLRFSEASVNGSVIQRPRRDVVDSTDSALAYQLIAGFSVPVRSWLTLAADYRYTHVPGLEFEEVTGDFLNTGYSTQSVWLRARLQKPARRAAVASGSAYAEHRDRGMYLSVLGGGSFAEDMGLENLLTIDAFAPGPVASVAVGYVWRDLWRFELEGAYRRNAIEIIELGPDIGEDPANGESRVFSLMANGIRSFRPGSPIRPRVGLGAGLVAAKFESEVFGFCARLVCGPFRRELFLNDRDVRPGFQAFAGVEVAVSERIRFTADYRYLITTKMQLRTPAGLRVAL